MQQESEFKIQNPHEPCEASEARGESKIQNPMAPRHNFDKQTAEFRIRIQETRSPREIMQENPESRIWTGLWGFCVNERGIQNSEFDGPRQGAEYFIIDNSRIRPDSVILHDCIYLSIALRAKQGDVPALRLAKHPCYPKQRYAPEYYYLADLYRRAWSCQTGGLNGAG